MADQQNRALNGAQRLAINRARSHNQLVHVRDRLFHTLFYKGALIYARTVPKPLRRFFEFLVLLTSFVFFFILVYIHLSFSLSASTCLDSVIANWSREGVLRIEIVKNLRADYGLEQSYAKEEKLTKLLKNDNGLMRLLVLKSELEPSSSIETNNATKTEPLTNSAEENKSTFFMYDANGTIDFNLTQIKWMKYYTNLAKDSFYDPVLKFEDNPEILMNISTKIEEQKNTTTSDSKFEERFYYDDTYIFEYSLEHGYLRLNSQTRKKLNIPIESVFLDPNKNECFGDSFTRILMDNILGYNDLIMASIKPLAENENNRGYLKNVISGEYYKFVNTWLTKASYIAAIMCMLIFTVVVSMLLRYAHHQIFVFIVDLLQALESNMTITFPTAPLLTVILALVGIEAIMADFFNSTSIAFYVILTVWFADQYDTICCHTPITKRHWLKFFYLYHSVFYGYHYRFSGQHAALSLFVTTMFILHSMIYFFHHYELPEILRQAQLQLLIRGAHQHHHPSHFRPHQIATTRLLRSRLTQLLSAVRPTTATTTQTSTINIVAANTAAASTNDVATSTSSTTITTNSGIGTSQSIQTTMVETAESQTSASVIGGGGGGGGGVGGATTTTEEVSIQTYDDEVRPPVHHHHHQLPHGGPDQS